MKLSRMHRGPGRIAWLAWVLLAAVPLCRAADECTPVNVADYPDSIKLACIGDSITQGIGAGKHNYPALLAKMLGEKWQVTNLGVSGSTLLKKGDNPYFKLKQFQRALELKPDVVTIALGTNDSKPQNWAKKADFAADYKEMIAELKKANPKVRIFCCLPVPAFPANFGINDPTIKNEVLPLIRAVAKETGSSVVDLYAALEGKGECVPDKVHPNGKGHEYMVAAIYKGLTGKEPPAIPGDEGKGEKKGK